MEDEDSWQRFIYGVLIFMTFQVGESPRFTDTVTDIDGNLADPSVIVISIRKPDGTLSVDAQVPIKSSTGVYYYDHTIAAQVGIHMGHFKCTGSGGMVSIHPFKFNVVESFSS